MMNAESKVTADHLKRLAYLYIRQSTLRQVLENTESTERQYALRRRALALGWSEERIVVIDNDQAHSGASAADREGFQYLVAEVGLGKAGIVMGLEVSRLARNCADWHRLLEICGLARTLILDEDGLYDPCHYNDRLLLGLKGTMSEAELHVLKARLVGGVISKAQRAELKMPLPVGLVYDLDDRVVLDPDQQVQQSLRVFFATFARVGSAWGTVRAFREQGLKFPKRGQAGSGNLVWQELTGPIALATLHNPRYAGAFCFGRTRSWKEANGKTRFQQLPRDQWRFLKNDVHPGYITWEQYLANQQRLLENQQAHGAGEHQSGPAREGPALLQGLVVCGKCGRGMTLRYHQRNGRLTPDYVCQRACVDQSQPVCQRLPGGGIDEAVGQALVESVTPLALEVVLNVHTEIQKRLADAERLRQQQVQRAQYEADQAQVRFMRVDPNNRLVAATLETHWNEKLRALTQAKEEYERQRQRDAAQVTDDQKAKILALASDFPKLWRDKKTSDRDRKRMARLLLEDVTLLRGQDILVQLRFKGGATKELRLPLPKSGWALRKTKTEIIAEIDRLLDHYIESEAARLLNERGWCSSAGCQFNLRIVNQLRRVYKLKSRRQRLREQGWLTVQETAALLGCHCGQVNHWRKAGLINSVRFSDKNDRLYEKPNETVRAQIQSRQRTKCGKVHNSPTCQLGAV
jgi:DNA invertase Pin-like site-specific DNA recombinase